MTLPRKVQEQADRSDALLDSLKNGQQPNKAPEPATTPAPASPPAQPADTQPPEPTPPEAPPQDSPAAPAPEPSPWEHRYKTLEGKYRAEVPRLVRELKAQQARNDELAAEIAALKSKPAVPAQSEPAGPDESMIDPDLLAVIKANAMKAARQEVSGLRPDVEKIKAERAKREAENEVANRRAEFISDLDDLVPGWKEIDNDVAFHAWLADFDESGNQRQETLMRAINSFHAAGAARIFNAFARSRPAATPQREHPAPPARLQVPDRAGGAPSTKAPQKRVFTNAEIQAFYRDAALGRYTDEQTNEIEREIREASQEGRIR